MHIDQIKEWTQRELGEKILDANRNTRIITF